MISSEDVRHVTFDKAFQGYRREDVDDYLKQVAQAMDDLAAQNDDLQKKLVMLAQRIEKYRTMENSLSTSMINAQRMGDSIIRESKQKAAEIIRSANIKAEDREQRARDDVELAKQEIVTLKGEADSFKRSLIEMYRKHINLINKLPDYTRRPEDEPVPPSSPAPEQAAAPAAEPQGPAPVREEPPVQETVSLPEQATLEPPKEAPWRIAGEVLRTYIICEDEGENVWLIDKHAAHERVRFDALKAAAEPVMTQTLLEPLAVELPPEDCAAVLLLLPELLGGHGPVKGLFLLPGGLFRPVQGVHDGIVHRVKGGFVGYEFHHGLGRMHVHVHPVLRQGQMQHAAGELPLQQAVAVRLLQGGGQQLAFHEPAVDKEQLAAPGAVAVQGPGHIARHLHVAAAAPDLLAGPWRSPGPWPHKRRTAAARRRGCGAPRPRPAAA